MNIPQSFKDAIADTFYDKTITRYSTQDTKDAHGHQAKAGTTVTNGSFMGNVHFDNFEKIQKQYGITEEIEIAITTADVIPQNEIIGYDGKQYMVFKVIKTDSHYLLVAKKWLSKSSTSISA